MSCALSFNEEAAIRRAGRVQVQLRDEDGGRTFTLDNAGLDRWRAANAVAEEIQLIDLIRALVDDRVIEPGFVLPNKFLPEIIMLASRDIRKILAREIKESQND